MLVLAIQLNCRRREGRPRARSDAMSVSPSSTTERPSRASRCLIAWLLNFHEYAADNDVFHPCSEYHPHARVLTFGECGTSLRTLSLMVAADSWMSNHLDSTVSDQWT